MADIYCPTCGEPWEMDSLHDEVKYRYPGEPWITEDKPEGVKEYKVHFIDPEKLYPWKSLDELGHKGWHNQEEYEKYYNEIRNDFYSRGCRAMMFVGGNKDYCKPKGSQKAQMAGAMYELLGDDLDGAAAMMEDYEYLFGDE